MSKSAPSDPEWYKNSVIYAVDISRFYDVNGDGVGDIRGLIVKLDYLKKLGVNCLWLLPFHPSGGRDNGYDVTNFQDVDQVLGRLEDFRTFMRNAKRKGFRIIMDLVIHHTSIRHPWFMAATGERATKFRDYYLWAEHLSPKIQAENSFPTVEDGVWQYDENINRYYRHQFYSSEPDLNVANPDVQAEIYNIIEYWLSFGIDGFRIDAATFLLGAKGYGDENLDGERYFEALRAFVAKNNPEAILIGEGDLPAKELPRFFGDCNRFHLLYNFMLNNSIYLGLATHDSRPIADRIEKHVTIREKGTWINFLRNSDELNLVHLKAHERDLVMAKFAPDPKIQIYGRGIRRRLPPMLDGNLRWLKMSYSLLFALPGVPMLYYGEEIGLGDDLSLAGRKSVRIPMQWDASHNAGFSSAPASKLVSHINMDPKYGYKKINVASQINKTTSFFTSIKKIIAVRKHYLHIVETPCPSYRLYIQRHLLAHAT
jgi:maltose alpha-D-glucosyltransferase/alpha-amylase